MVKLLSLPLALIFALAAFASFDPTCSNCIFKYHGSTTLSLPIYCVPTHGGNPTQCGTVNAIEDPNQVLHFKILASSSYCFDDATIWLASNSPNTTGNLRIPVDQWPYEVSGGGQCKGELDFSISIADLDEGNDLCDQELWFALTVTGWKDKYSTEPGCNPVEYSGCAKGDFQFSDSPLKDCAAANCWFTRFLLCSEYCPPPPPCPAVEFPGIGAISGVGFTIDLEIALEPNFLNTFGDINCSNGRRIVYGDWAYVARLIINTTNLPDVQECWDTPGTILLSNCNYPFASAVVFSLIPAGIDSSNICDLRPGSGTQCGSFFEPCLAQTVTFEYSPYSEGIPAGANVILYFFTNNPTGEINLFCEQTGGARVGGNGDLVPNLSINN